ncbi:MAG: restriction endonuclease subunit S [Elusimicrobia bacterium]|nr:restriction endonuclease subunit S [Elusimicrobiota bacterium]
MKRLKYLTEINPPLPHDQAPEPDDEVSFLPMERIGEEGSLDLSEILPARSISNGYTAMLDGDVVIAKITPCFENGKGALCCGLHGGVGFGTTELIVLRAKKWSDPRYLYWLTRGHHFRDWGEAEMRGSAGQRRVTEEFVSNYRSANLELADQRQIARYLDEATGKVDRLLTLRRRQMDLLRDQRAALIQQAVTRGLNPNAPLKDSGLPWLGQIPKHWEVKRLKFLCNVTTGGKDTINAEPDGEFPFFVRSQTVERINCFSFDGEAVLTAGDGVGVGKVFHYYNGKLEFHQRVYLLHNFHHVTGKFFFQYMRSLFHSVALGAEAKSTVDSLRMHIFLNFEFCIPPAAEQAKIVEWIEQEEARFEALLSSYSRQLELLTEYRSALIHECVTGQRAAG